MKHTTTTIALEKDNKAQHEHSKRRSDKRDHQEQKGHRHREDHPKQTKNGESHRREKRRERREHEGASDTQKALQSSGRSGGSQQASPRETNDASLPVGDPSSFETTIGADGTKENGGPSKSIRQHRLALGNNQIAKFVCCL